MKLKNIVLIAAFAAAAANVIVMPKNGGVSAGGPAGSDRSGNAARSRTFRSAGGRRSVVVPDHRRCRGNSGCAFVY